MRHGFGEWSDQNGLLRTVTPLSQPVSCTVADCSVASEAATAAVFRKHKEEFL